MVLPLGGVVDNIMGEREKSLGTRTKRLSNGEVGQSCSNMCNDLYHIGRVHIHNTSGK